MRGEAPRSIEHSSTATSYWEAGFPNVSFFHISLVAVLECSSFSIASPCCIYSSAIASDRLFSVSGVLSSPRAYWSRLFVCWFGISLLVVCLNVCPSRLKGRRVRRLPSSDGLGHREVNKQSELSVYLPYCCRENAALPNCTTFTWSPTCHFPKFIIQTGKCPAPVTQTRSHRCANNLERPVMNFFFCTQLLYFTWHIIHNQRGGGILPQLAFKAFCLSLNKF